MFATTRKVSFDVLQNRLLIVEGEKHAEKITRLSGRVKIKTRIQIWHFQSVKHFHFQFDLDNGLIEECVERKLSQKLGPNSTSQVPISHFSFRLLVVSYLSQDHIG